jgi:regulator of protease activity HflC (stomatin/prohibitin superfamily)
LVIAGYVGSLALMLWSASRDHYGAVAGGMGLLLVTIFVNVGLFVVNPNESRVMQLFGDYVGTVKSTGFHWANPLYKKRRVSLRLQNFETGTEHTPERKDKEGHTLETSMRVRRPSKVNDRDGNPVEIAAVVSWKVVDTYAAVFHVDDYVDYVKVQSESALRALASRYPYDTEHDHVVSLRGDADVVAAELVNSLHDRLEKAGVEVYEARISHLAYAPEIAAAMLQRQQASAIIAARRQIVDGAVSIVDEALRHLSERDVVHLDDERRAAMVSNLLVVLCSHNPASPVINAGTLY